MRKIPENFVKSIKKLEGCLVLREEEDYLLMGTEITIKEHKEISGNIFQPYSKNVDRNIYICFLISFDKEKLGGQFRKIPTLCLDPQEKKYKVSALREDLDNFLREQFR